MIYMDEYLKSINFVNKYLEITTEQLITTTYAGYSMSKYSWITDYLECSSSQTVGNLVICAYGAEVAKIWYCEMAFSFTKHAAIFILTVMCVV
eukprot:CAMPEP_0204910472 /NCGR_PEP_ID=MMETSP1397-20131031/8998_1 /ASSEMBLY_ACC=CAM_ASM_000891 /TAXON_ID=49980 /ORGANISM="Climacostomum Climacostomum virens, Strain Stock W-24" /LENGTH=92 /DNA_ID=CAMNT_0052080655 /DNA_START=440 /DNA_END=714 /DNA_ORIENTATION=-